MSTITRVKSVLVSNETGANTGTSLATIVDGDILVLNRAMANLTGTPTITSAADNDVIYIAMGTGAVGEFKLSHPIQVKNISKVEKEAYAAAVKQVSHIGFNGTSGNFTVENDTEYQMIIRIMDTYRIQPQRPTFHKYNVISDSTATAIEVLSRFVKKINGDSNIKIAASLLTNGTFTALTNNATVTNGSKTVTSTAHGLAVGDLVRIGGTTATASVYLVASVTSANIFELDTLYQGASGTVLAANIGKITVPTAFGIQLVGETLSVKAPDLHPGELAFKVSLAPELGSEATVTYSTSKDDGKGIWQQIRDLEYFAQGYEGITNRTLFPTNVPATKAASGNNYATLVIEHTDVHGGDFQNLMNSPLSTIIAIDTNGASTKYNAVVDIIESLVESAGTFVE
jgi:hypothetical protein